MRQLDEITAKVKKVKCPICKSKMICPKSNFHDVAHFMTEDEETIYNAETWCSGDPQHYRMVFEWIENGDQNLICEDLLLFDDEHEYTVERFLISKRINIITRYTFESLDDTIVDLPDPGSSLRKFNLQKLYTLLTFK